MHFIFLLLSRNKERQKSREEKLLKYLETGVWPGMKVKKRKTPTVPWSESQQRKLNRKERKKRKKEVKWRKIEEGKIKKKKRKNPLSEQEIQELMYDVALLKKHRKQKVKCK